MISWQITVLFSVEKATINERRNKNNSDIGERLKREEREGKKRMTKRRKCVRKKENKEGMW